MYSFTVSEETAGVYPNQDFVVSYLANSLTCHMGAILVGTLISGSTFLIMSINSNPSKHCVQRICLPSAFLLSYARMWAKATSLTSTYPKVCGGNLGNSFFSILSNKNVLGVCLWKYGPITAVGFITTISMSISFEKSHALLSASVLAYE